MKELRNLENLEEKDKNIEREREITRKEIKIAKREKV